MTMLNEINFERLIIAAYRLPFKFVKAKNGYKAVQNSGGLVSAILALSENFKNSKSRLEQNKIVWTGVSDSVIDNLSAREIENEHFDIYP